jgi:hypothetical protein
MRNGGVFSHTRESWSGGSTIPIMATGGNQASGPGPDASQLSDPGWRSWQDGIRQRLSRSATIALLLSPVGLLLISVTRLLIVSDYSTVTASAVVSSGGYVDSLLGTIIPIVPLVLPYIMLILLFFNRVILGVLALLATALTSPVTIGRPAFEDLARKDWHSTLAAPVLADVLMGLFAFFAVVLLLVIVIRVGFGHFARTMAIIGCLALIPFVSQAFQFPAGKSLYAGLLRQPWLPAEMITLRSGQRIVGFVLADDGGSLALLANDNRAVYYYPDSTVAGRQVCNIGPAGQGQPLIAIIPAGTEPPRAPRCRSRPGPVHG